MGILWMLGFLLACDGELERDPEPATGGDPSEATTLPGILPGTPRGGLAEWIADVATGLEGLGARVATGDPDAGQRVVELYVTRQEFIERYYGPGGLMGGGPELGDAVRAAESRFHDLMALTGGGSSPDSTAVAGALNALSSQYDTVLEEARAAGVPLDPHAADLGPRQQPDSRAPIADPGSRREGIRVLMAELKAVDRMYGSGDREGALEGLQRAYLERLEPLEPLLPMGTVTDLERLIHLRLRPAIARGAPEPTVRDAFEDLFASLSRAEASAAADTPFWLGAFNSFMIIVREGLEAVLLIGAILAYLGRIPASERHRRRVYAGAGVGVLASLLTWFAAQGLITVGAGARELIEGATALLAVVVLIYVSNWLFHKTYVRDWKRYLERHFAQAVTAGSTLAMAGLAFAAVYREGFETVLFYQALLFDAGAMAILTGLAAGLLVVLGLAVAIIRLGLRLPLRRLFTWTSVALLYIALVFLGSGLYDLQEAGLFIGRPVDWVPDHQLLRQLFGFYPLAETLVAQALLLLFAVSTFAWYRYRVAPQRARAG